MNWFQSDWMTLLVRMNLFLMAASVIVSITLRTTRTFAPKIHRVAWALVLAQCVMLSPWVIRLPVLESASSNSTWHERVAVTSAQKALVTHINESTARPNDQAADDAYSADPMQNYVASQPVFELGAAFDAAAIPWETWLFATWLGGIAASITMGLLGYHRFVRDLTNASVAPSQWKATWEGMLRQQNVSVQIPMLVHENLGPLLCRIPVGYRIVVPRQLWQSLSQHERSAVLRHELAHYQRRDIWKSLVARVIALPHWFNPTVWFAVQRFDEAAEWSCDDHIARHNPRHVPDYARVLLRLVEMESPRPGISAAAGAPLAQRIRRLLSEARPNVTRA